MFSKSNFKVVLLDLNNEEELDNWSVFFLLNNHQVLKQETIENKFVLIHYI